MNDLVSKKRILDAVKPMFRLVGNGDNPLSIVYNRCLNDVLDAIRRMPEVDAVEVVRCVNCKRWRPDGTWGLDLDNNKRRYGTCVVTHMWTAENHFCGYGAKMDGEK